MNNSLYATSLSRFKKNNGSYIAVGIMCGLFLILLSATCFFDPIIFLFLIPLLFFPFLFASHVACYSLENKERITIRAFGHYFIGFFHNQYRNSFRGLISFLKTLGVYFTCLFIVYFILYFINYQAYGAQFTDSLREVVTAYAAPDLSYEDLMVMLEANDGMLLTFFFYMVSFSTPLTVVAFTYFISISSISIYYRVNVRGVTNSLMRIAINRTFAKVGWKIRKDWCILNWPLFVIPVLGGTTGILITIFLIKDISFLIPITYVGSIIFLIFFFPFYFSNMEVIYHRYEEAFKLGNQEAINIVLSRIQTTIELSEEEKKDLENSFKESNPEEEENK